MRHRRQANKGETNVLADMFKAMSLTALDFLVSLASLITPNIYTMHEGSVHNDYPES